MRELAVYDTHYLTLTFREGKGGKMQGEWELKKQNELYLYGATNSAEQGVN